MESSGFSGKPRNSSRGEDNEGLSESPDQLFDGDNQQLRKEKDESSVLENQTIYTPSASTESLRSDELLSSKAPLLSGQPPSYQDATSIPVEWSQHNLEKGDSPDKARSPDAVKGAKLGITYPRPGKWRVSIFWISLTCFLICNVIAVRHILRVNPCFSQSNRIFFIYLSSR